MERRWRLRDTLAVGTRLFCRCGFLGWRSIRIRHVGRDEVTNLLDLLLASVGDEVTREHLGGKQRGPRKTNPGILAEQFALIEGFHGASWSRRSFAFCMVPDAACSTRAHCSGRIRTGLLWVLWVVSVIAFRREFPRPMVGLKRIVVEFYTRMGRDRARNAPLYRW